MDCEYCGPGTPATGEGWSESLCWQCIEEALHDEAVNRRLDEIKDGER